MSGIYNASRHCLVVSEDKGSYKSAKVIYLELDEICRDGGTQPRAVINLHHVKLLEEQMEDGQQLEPITVFYDGELYWLADGFHRWYAHRNRQEDAIACVIYTGNRRDAVLYSVGANADNKPALPRSRVDKHRSVITLMQDEEWGTWSDNQIAKQCKVSQPFVSKLRQNLTYNVISENSTRTYKTKHGNVAKMHTAKIGNSQKKAIKEESRVRLKDDQPLFPAQSGTITQLPLPDAAIVQLDNGTRELIPLQDLNTDLSNPYQIAHHLKFVPGGLVEIRVPTNNKINGRLGRIAAVHESTVDIWLRNVNTMTVNKHTLKHQHVEPVPMSREPQLVEICDRLNKLTKCELDPFEVQILSLLEQPVVFTPVELEYLAHIEHRYGIHKT
ncbi:MAG: ParB N-terminal domain-containing protein [Rhizonema sp. PD37]|nr:ParB N-terminal domain-containing protein [Rhizonema sp. PD37]